MSAVSDGSRERLAAELGELLKRRGWLAATAESCTGGWVAETITAIAGCSEWFDRGFVTYSGEAKQDMLGVPATTIAVYGEVSSETAAAMATGALDHSRASLAVSITGIAGPTGGSTTKPVGTVWFGFAVGAGQVATRHRLFEGDRRIIRLQAVIFAVEGLINLAQDHSPDA